LFELPEGKYRAVLKLLATLEDDAAAMPCACGCCVCDDDAFFKSAPAPACNPDIQLNEFFATASLYIETAVEHWRESDYQYDPFNKPKVNIGCSASQL
jgi:hypothetical protein